jgi:hypothetical protein
VADIVDSLTKSIRDTLAAVVERFLAVAARVIESIVSSVSGALTGAVSLLSETFDNIAGALQGAFESAVSTLTGLAEQATLAVGSLIDSVVEFVGQLSDQVAAEISDAFADLGAFADDISAQVAELIEVALTGTRSLAARIGELVESIPQQLGELADQMATAARESLAEPLREIPEAIWKALSTLWGQLTEGDREKLNAALDEFVLSGASPPRSREEVISYFNLGRPTGAIAQHVTALVVFLVTFMSQAAAMGAPNLEVLNQETWSLMPTRLLEVRDLIESERRGLIDRDEALAEMRAWGYDPARASQWIALRDNTIPEADALSWRHRGILSDEETRANLHARGWIDRDVEALLQASLLIPPVPDLIAMAVREAFSPEIAERFGQFEDFPAPFAEAAAQQGISAEWAERYWAAHWSLPSIQMGFEMVHRGVISTEDLNLLLRAQDIMPFWRDKLTQISFSPLTRVDIRRMHKVKVLTEADVNRAYRDIGYSDLNAERLTEFTLRLNAPKATEDVDELAKLTRASVMGFFADGIIDAARARSLLLDLGVSEQATELYIGAKEADLERTDRKEQIDLIVAQQRAGILAFDAAQDKLSGLGLETREQERAVTKLLREKAAATRLPARGSLDKMFTAKVIDRGEYLATLQARGYSEKWAKRYLEMVEMGIDAGQDTD